MIAWHEEELDRSKIRIFSFNPTDRVWPIVKQWIILLGLKIQSSFLMEFPAEEERDLILHDPTENWSFSWKVSKRGKRIKLFFNPLVF